MRISTRMRALTRARCSPADAREDRDDHRAQHLHAQLLPAIGAGIEHAAADCARPVPRCSWM